MNPAFNTWRMVFLISFLPAIASALGLFIGGTYDGMTPGKLVAVFVLAFITGTINGLLAVRALNTEPINPRDMLPRNPNQPNPPP